MRQQDTYGEPEVTVYPNAIVRVYHPILTPEERERRQKEIADAAADLIKEMIKEEKRREQH